MKHKELSCPIKMNSKLLAGLVLFGLVILGQPEHNEAVRVRCGIFSFLGNDRACRASCWLSGQKTGKCDSEGNCNCNEEELDISESVRNLLGGLSITDYLKKTYNSFAEEVESWEISENLKSLAPSRCRLGNGFCETSCHSIGRETGSCNADFSDCDCSDTIVTPKQYGLCLDDGICSLYCQRKQFATGNCRGPTNWDCECVSTKGEHSLAPDFDGEIIDEFN